MCKDSGKSVNAIKSSGKKQQKGGSQKKVCSNCTRQHAPGCDNCPAKDSQCHHCKKIGHWAPKCRSKAQSESPSKPKQGKKKSKKTHQINIDDSDEVSDEITCGAIHIGNITSDSSDNQKEAFTKVEIPGSAGPRGFVRIHVKIDSGSGAKCPAAAHLQVSAPRPGQQEQSSTWLGSHFSVADNLHW